MRLNSTSKVSLEMMHVGIGCVMRDNNGKWLGGEGRNIGFFRAITSELHAIPCGLMLAWMCGHRQVVLEPDSTKAIKCVLGSCKGNKEYQRVIVDYKELISRDWVLTIKYIGREANRAAGRVA